MCGIAGIISPNPLRISSDSLKKMADALSHRGPDGEGFWTNANNQVGFAHRRLAIIDLSNGAAQPMHFSDRYTIIHNGEIYNYIELREELVKKGYRFTTLSDTEVILAAYEEFREDCVQYFDGMFSFAIWDEKEQELFAARDRFGEKPFFYYVDEKEGTFYFASEMKALWALGIEKSVDGQSLLFYLGLGYTKLPVERERTFYKNIYSLPPAHSIKLVAASQSILVQQYWDIERAEVYEGSVDNAVERFRELFLNSVKRRLRSDVSLGTSLSGGLDSSSIVAAINGISGMNHGYNCFSASFPGFNKDESAFAKKVTEKFALTGNFAKPSAEGFVEDFKKLCFHHESPFGSSSVYAQYKVFELAKEKGVKVLLDGQGADEMLGGYQKYIHWWLQELLFKRKFLSYRTEKRAFESNKIKWNWGIKNKMAAFVPGMAALELQSRAAKKLKRIPGISQAFLHAYYDFDYCNKPIVRELNDILYYNTLQFGLEELLIYADRNSMAHGREVRLPFLNHELVEFAFSLQSSYKMKHGFTKWILRESIKKELPAEITWRTDKIGFEPPQYEWMNHPSLRDMVLESRKKLITAGILKKDLLQNPVIPQTAFAEDNYDWRYLVAGTLISI